jgi:hypothetical protein
VERVKLLAVTTADILDVLPEDPLELVTEITTGLETVKTKSL